jgi:hypothetical protein
MDSNFNTVACAADLRSYCKYATQRRKSLDISAECCIPRHAAPFRATPHDAALVSRDAAFMSQLLWQIPH